MAVTHLLGLILIFIGIHIDGIAEEEFENKIKELTKDMPCNELKHTFFNSESVKVKDHVTELYLWNCVGEIEN